MHRAPSAVAELLGVATTRGITQARMALKPHELGGIEIRLQSSSAGVIAQVVADSPEATRLLHQAAGDLRRSLEAQGVTLLSLEISTSTPDKDPNAPSAGLSAQADGRDEQTGSGTGQRGRTGEGALPTTPDDLPTTSAITLTLPSGVHVDVLA
jgi:flagellar hook-length control protein FliK